MQVWRRGAPTWVQLFAVAQDAGEDDAPHGPGRTESSPFASEAVGDVVAPSSPLE